jgi:twitching motility protein PilT
MTPLLPDDNDLAPLAKSPSNQPSLASSQMLRGLLEDGALLLDPVGSPSSLAGVNTLDESRSVPSVTPLTDTHIDDILRYSQQVKASDIHLTVNLPPMVRIDGKITPTPWETVTPREVQRLVYDILLSDQIERFERTKELDFSYGVSGIGRFRFNVFRQRHSIGCAMRAIPAKIPSLESLRLPAVLKQLTQKHSGIILVTGPTGSGKSTTIASMIDVINTERPVHILTMEDPIEYLHAHKVGMVNQREIGQDTASFSNAIRAALREDPDVILVGEMRDKETIAAALTLAETGHLVFGTLHTRSAPSTVDRVIDVFPADQQDQIRVQFAGSLQAVVAQQLLPMVGGGRVAAIEIMVATAAVRNLIREGKSHQLMSSIETGAQYGMQQMDKVLAELHRNGVVTMEEAAARCNDRDNFMRHLKGGA